MLTPTEGSVRDKGEISLQGLNIEVRNIRNDSKSQTPDESRTKILIVDRKEYLVVELKDDSKQTFVEAVQLAIYSDTQSTVRSYLTLFDSLWDQSNLYRQLEAHDKMQREFINIAAHELRTPIQPIIGLVELLEPSVLNKTKIYILSEEGYDVLSRNAKRLERLAVDILEVSRIESNTIKLNKEKFDINE